MKDADICISTALVEMPPGTLVEHTRFGFSDHTHRYAYVQCGRLVGHAGGHLGRIYRRGLSPKMASWLGSDAIVRAFDLSSSDVVR